jgi:hypothetical protein
MRRFFFAALVVLVSSQVGAETLPWLAAKPEPVSATPVPPAKFFAINPAALMRPVTRSPYGIDYGRVAAPAAKPRPSLGAAMVNEDQARKLLSLYQFN